MSLPIHWNATALDDLDEIVAYIAQFDRSAAIRLQERLESAVLPLALYPYMYRASERVLGVREIIAHPSYRILYRVTTDCVEVVSVVHVRRQYPSDSDQNL